MYDQETAELIRGAPELGGIDASTLPQELTRAYSWITSVRVRFADGDVGVGNALQEQTGKLRRFARAYELYSASLPGSEDRRSAAFVAASAHQLLHQMRTPAVTNARPSVLSRSHVSSDIAATLLFLSSGYPSDAGEIAPRSEGPLIGTVEDVLIRSLGCLARGNLTRILEMRVTVDADGRLPDGEATSYLWHQLLAAVRTLAVALLGRESNTVEAAGPALALIRHVRDVTVHRVTREAFAGVARDFVPSEFFSTFVGPHHFAVLLESAANRLLDDAIVKIPAPAGVDSTFWNSTLRRLAERRPYLWVNHLEAIASGYLEPGTSSVVSFPTGAGKSTIAELKIAATIAAGRSVLFLAPTRALVRQVDRNLQRAFDGVDVLEVFGADGSYDETLFLGRPQIAVMTPERCLTFLGAQPEAFDHLGLIVFDECHLLHPTQGERDRRSLDAMVCLLGLMQRAPDADVVLMSAMISNAKELSGWLADVTGRRCVPLTSPWKPTRQARGCVVYDQAQYKSGVRELRKWYAAKQPGRRSPPKPAVAVVPYGLFGLTHSWQRRIAPRDYSLVSLLDTPVFLTDSRNGRFITPNKNKVAAELAAKVAAAGLKVIVFVQDKAACHAIARDAAARVPKTRQGVTLTRQEQSLFDAAWEEVGSAGAVWGPVTTTAAVHHSLLLPPERELAESIFRRRSGASVLVATPTLAQGMNLPADVVIIAGEARFDTELQSRIQMQAHEVLNAAGRAGRAGDASAGLVLVVPEQVVTTVPDLSDVSGHWRELSQSIFEKHDQCLELNDPIGMLLDRVVASNLRSRGGRYFLERLPINENDPGADEAARSLLSRSLSGYQARRSGDERQREYQKKVAFAISQRNELLGNPEKVLWLDRLASELGFRSVRIKSLHERLLRLPIEADASTLSCVDWLFDWLGECENVTEDLLELYQLKSGLTKGEVARLDVNPDSGGVLMSRNARDRVKLWMSGADLITIDKALGEDPAKSEAPQHARKFVKDFVWAVSYIGGAVSRMARSQIEQGVEDSAVSVGLGTLGACIREGMDSPEKLAIRHLSRGEYWRKQCHRIHAYVAAHIPAGAADEVFSTTVERVQVGMLGAGVPWR